MAAAVGVMMRRRTCRAGKFTRLSGGQTLSCIEARDNGLRDLDAQVGLRNFLHLGQHGGDFLGGESLDLALAGHLQEGAATILGDDARRGGAVACTICNYLGMVILKDGHPRVCGAQINSCDPTTAAAAAAAAVAAVAAV